MVREFAEREIAPNVMKWDEACEFPLATVKELGKLGLLGMIFPTEYGGAGMGYVEYVTAIEELSRVDGSVGIIVAAHTSLCSNHIFLAGNEEQKRKYIPKLATRRVDRRMGVDRAGFRLRRRRRALTAVRKGERWVLNGNKTFITNGHYADVAVVIAVTDKTQRTRMGFRRSSSRRARKGFRARQERKQARPARQRHRRADLRGLRDSRGESAGQGRRGFIDAMRVLDGGRISIAALGAGHGAGRLRSGAEVRRRSANSSARRSASFRPSSGSWPTWRPSIDAARLLT